MSSPLLGYRENKFNISTTFINLTYLHYIGDSSTSGCCRRFDIFLRRLEDLLLTTDVSPLNPAPLLQPRSMGLTTTRTSELPLSSYCELMIQDFSASSHQPSQIFVEPHRTILQSDPAHIEARETSVFTWHSGELLHRFLYYFRLVIRALQIQVCQ